MEQKSANYNKPAGRNWEWHTDTLSPFGASIPPGCVEMSLLWQALHNKTGNPEISLEMSRKSILA